MKYSYLTFLLFCCLLLGSGCISELVLKKDTIVPYTDRIELQGKLSPDGAISLTGKSVIKGKTTPDTPIGVKPNYRQSVWIRQIWADFVNLLKCWFWDLLIVTVLIAVMTELLGNSVRPYGIKIPKVLWSAVLAGISALVFRIFLASGWGYALALNGLACLTANLSWHYCVNLFKVQRLAGLFRRRTATIARV